MFQAAAPIPVCDAKGILLVPVSGPTREVSTAIYAHHAERAGDVVPCLVAAFFPGVLPAAFTAAMINAKEIVSVPEKRFLVVVDDAGSLSATAFKHLVDVLRRGFGPSFNARVRMQLVFSRFGEFSFSPFYESRVFCDPRIRGRAVVAIPTAEATGPETAGQEFISRVSSPPYGADPCDPWVSSLVAAQNAAKPGPSDFDTADPVTLVAATRGGLAAAVEAVAGVVSGGNVDALIAGFTRVSGVSGERMVTVRFPYSLRSRSDPLGFTTVVEVTVDGLGDDLVRGTTLLWDGQAFPAGSIFDEDTVGAEGVHILAPNEVLRADQSPAALECFRETRPGTFKAVRVPVFWGSPATVAVWPTGLCRGPAGARLVSGHTVGNMAVGKGSARLMFSPESFSVEEYGAAVADYTGQPWAIQTAPVPGGRLEISFPPPYGRGPPKRRHLDLMGVQKTKPVLLPDPGTPPDELE